MDPSSSGKPPRVEWDSGKILGRGRYGTVCLGFLNDESSRTPVAVKSAASGSKGEAALRREKELLDQLRGCPQIVRCYGDAATTDEENKEGVDGEVRTYNIFLEYAPKGSLRDYLQLRPMDEPLARRLTRSMLQGLAHIHRHGVAHCDIKPDNVMLWGADEVKIIDFGLALRSCESVDERTLFRGSAYYLAPECIARLEYKAPADVWALGCTLAEMLTGKPARAYLDDVPGMEFLALIGRGQAPPKVPEHMSEFGRSFLSRCFEVDPRKRWTAEMLLRHPYVAPEGDSSSSIITTTARFLAHEMLIAQ